MAYVLHPLFNGRIVDTTPVEFIGHKKLIKMTAKMI